MFAGNPVVPHVSPNQPHNATASDGRPSPWWTVDEAAAYLRCARVTVYRMIKSGRLRAKKCGRDWRTRQEWIDNGALLDVE